jgi:hypothetical protein
MATAYAALAIACAFSLLSLFPNLGFVDQLDRES